MRERNRSIIKILAGFVLGTSAGIAFSLLASPETVERAVKIVSPFGEVLIAMLKMAVYPVILFSLISGAASLQLRRSGKVGGAVIAWYTATSLFATVFGVAMAYVMNPSIANAEKVSAGSMSSASAMTGAGAASSVASFFTGLFQNPFSALAGGQFLPIIVYAIFFGIAARMSLESGLLSESAAKAVKSVVELCEGAQTISFKIIDIVIMYFPIGVAALSFANFATNGTLLFGPYVSITAAVVVGVLGMMFFVYPILIALFCRQNPFRVMLRLREPMLTAFVTRSSAATLPISFKAMDSLGVDRSLSGFSLPMGATVNMDGVCVHLPVFVILAANIFGHDLSLLQVATLCLSIMFASVGAGGIPGGSIFLLFMVLESMGLQSGEVVTIVALALGINPILDMFETCCNVTGDNVCTYIVSKIISKNKPER
jgi:Na+/H+-dicarboxylate symporter